MSVLLTKSDYKQCMLVDKIHAYVRQIALIHTWIYGFCVLKFSLAGTLSCRLKITRTNFGNGFILVNKTSLKASYRVRPTQCGQTIKKTVL